MRRKRAAIGLLVAGIISACGGAAVASEHHPAARHQASRRGSVPSSCPHKGRYQPEDPRQALPLPGNAIAPAVTGALYQAEHQGNSRLRRIRRDGRAYNAEIALPWKNASKRHNSVVLLCGTRIGRRTVIVNLFFPHARPSVSLAYSSLWVSKFPRQGYRIWYVFH